MPGCAAVGCNNRSEKGFIMKCFPRDPKLRKIWQERVARADWEPSNNSFLCHVHFEPKEWCIADNGKVRLKRNAVPSIFTVTSTRKSPKKRTKLKSDNNENECENEYTTMYLENDTEHSSTGHLEEKDSDSQDVDDPSVQSFIYQRVSQSSEMMENKQIYHKQYNDLQQEDILISDDSVETRDIKACEIGKQINKENKTTCDFISKDHLTDNLNKNRIKIEIKPEIDQTSIEPDSHDEIEERLKQICDGYHEESNPSNTEKLNSTFENQKKVAKQTSDKIPLYRSINYKCSSKNDIGDMLTNDTENIEIIFCTENGDEHSTRSPKCVSYNNGEAKEIENINQCGIDNVGSDKVTDKTYSDVEGAFNKQNIINATNIVAAMKRKRRTRDSIMKSIEKSIRSISSQDTNSLSDSDISDDIDEISEIQKKSKKAPVMQYNNCVNIIPAATKFTIKVTGYPDDVFDIMHNLPKDTNETNIQEYTSSYDHKENNELITSVITIDDSLIEADITGKSNDGEDTFLANIENITSKHNAQVLPSTSKIDQYPGTRLMSHSDEEPNNLSINGGYLTPVAKSITQLPTSNCSTKYEYERLQRKLKTQEDVVKKLTDQLIMCKGVEKDLRSKNEMLEKRIETLTYEYSAITPRDANQSSLTKKIREDPNFRQKLIDDLANRLSYFEEANKKLIKGLAVESQRKKKLEGQVKQRDNRIKELDWKLEKASKFLERAEKNTNTYKRKMLNMQSFLRRKKLLDEKVGKLNEILIDCVKESYAGKTLSMRVAMDIKKTCGAHGYDKLITFGIPLPPLSTLRTIPGDNVSDSIESLRFDILKSNASEECDFQSVINDEEVDIKVENTESISKEIALDGAETITGTVQDIFDENNGDDFSTNELTEDFISQLHTTM